MHADSQVGYVCEDSRLIGVDVLISVQMRGWTTQYLMSDCAMQLLLLDASAEKWFLYGSLVTELGTDIQPYKPMAEKIGHQKVLLVVH